MSNKAFLHVSDSERASPAFRDPNVKAQDSVLLCCDLCVPLLWISMFRPEDVRNDAFEAKGKRYEAIAPVVAKEIAVERLSGTSARWNRILGTHWDLSPLEVILAGHIRKATGRNVSIDPFELDGVDTALAGALRAYETGDPTKKSLILDITTVMPDRPAIYDPLHPKKTPEATENDYYNTMRMIGYGWYSEVPWDVYPEAPAATTINSSAKRWWQVWK